MPHTDPEKRRQYLKEYRDKNKEIIVERKRLWREKHKERIKAKSRHYLDTNRELINIRRMNSYLKCAYGITYEQQKQMFIAQEGKCAICGRPFTDRKNMHVDHDHNTGQVRELLCQNCNQGIGLLNEDISLLSKAINYLNKWKN